MSPLYSKFLGTQGIKRIKRIPIFLLGIRSLLRLPNISNLSIDWARSGRIAIRILIRIAFGVVLVLSMIRDYLLGNGLYIYRDRSWPLSTSLFPQAIFSPSAIANSTPDPFGFSRIFFTWPILIIDSLSSDVIVTEKIFILYLLGTFLFLAFLLAHLSLKLLNKASGRTLSFWRGETFSLILVLLVFANFWSLQQLSDMYFTYVVEFLLLMMALAVVLLWEGNYRSIFFGAGLLSLGVFLDPNLFLHEFVALAIVILAFLLLKSPTKRTCLAALSRIACLLTLCLPVLVTMLYVLEQTTGTKIRPPGLYQISTANLSLPNAVRLLGYYWSLIAYAPPTILNNTDSITSLGTMGFPPYMVFPTGWITSVWFATTWSVPLFSFSTLFLRQFRKITIPSATVGAVGILLTQPALFPIPYLLASILAPVPVIGGAMVTQYALPDHVLIMVAGAYVLMMAVGIHFLLSVEVNRIRLLRLPFRLSSRSVKFGKKIIHFFIIITALSLLVFPSWQLFSGSFFPAGYTAGLPGNGISSIGTFTPSIPPVEMSEVYRWLISQPGSYNVYWPGAEGSTYSWSEKATPSISWLDSPRPSFVTTTTPSVIFPVGLRFLLANASSYDLIDYLRALNLRYLVVQPSSKVGLVTSWGLSNITDLRNKLNITPGLSIAHQSGDIAVYEVNMPWGETYSPNIVATYGSRDQDYTLAYSIFGSLGLRSAIVADGVPSRLCFDVSSCEVSVFSTTFLANQLPPALVFNTPAGMGGPSTTIDLPANTNYHIPPPWEPWTFTNWGSGNATVSIVNNLTYWNFPTSRTTLSLNYNGTVTANQPGGVAVPLGELALVRIGFWYKAAGASNVSLRIVLPTLDKNQGFVTDVVSPEFSLQDGWTYATFNDTLPIGTAYFTSRIQATASSTSIEIRNLQVEVRFLRNYPDSPFGNLLQLPNDIPLKIGNASGSIYIQYTGDGLITAGDRNETLAPSSGLSWVADDEWNGGNIVGSGNVSIAALVIASSPIPSSDIGRVDSKPDCVNRRCPVVFTRGFAPGYSLTDSEGTHSPIPTLDGMNLFEDVAAGSYSITFSSLTPIIVAYLSTLGWVTAILIVSATGMIDRRIFETKKTEAI